MFTRKQYMDGECSYADYYGDVVEAAGITISQEIADQVETALAHADEPLNSISLARWDVWAAPWRVALQRAFKERGDFWSMGGAVCAMKEAARRHVKV